MTLRPARLLAAHDPAEDVARIALSKRDLLLRVHARRLRHEDLEDCFSQAMLELVQRARKGLPFVSDAHVENSLEQKLLSRIRDRHRAVAGRSGIEAAYAGAASIEDPGSGVEEVSDLSSDVEDLVAGRLDVARLREICEELSPDQRLAIASQVGLQMSSGEFCRRHGWTQEKFRKVAQRGRARLRALAFEYATGERCRRLAGDLDDWCGGALEADREARLLAHLANCTACRRAARERAPSVRAKRRRSFAAALWPGPVLGFVHALRSLLGGRAARAAPAGHGAGTTGALATGAAGSGAATPSLLGIGGAKLGFSALCVVGAAGGGLAVCDRAASGHHGVRHASHRHALSKRAPATVAARQPSLSPSSRPAPTRRPSPTATATVTATTSAASRPASRGGRATREFGVPALAPATPKRPAATVSAAHALRPRSPLLQQAPAVRHTSSAPPTVSATFERRPVRASHGP